MKTSLGKKMNRTQFEIFFVVEKDSDGDYGTLKEVFLSEEVRGKWYR